MREARDILNGFKTSLTQAICLTKQEKIMKSVCSQQVQRFGLLRLRCVRCASLGCVG